MTQTNPEQWAVELWRKACHDYGGASIEGSPAEWRAALTIQTAFAEQNARLVGALEEIRDLPGEINPSNYDHDDACELNRQFCYAFTIADAALKDRTQ